MTNASFTVLGAFWQQDSPLLLEKALDSICSNTLLPQEIVLVQDGPVPTSLLKVVENYSADIPLRLITLHTNTGLGHAMNVGLESVSTPFVIRFDADDISWPNRFMILMSKLTEGYALVGSQVCESNGQNNQATIRRVPKSEKEIRSYIRYRNPFNHMTVGFSRDAILGVGGYPDIKLREDYALWAQLLASDNRVCNIEEVLVHASVGDNMIRRRGGVRSAISELRLQKLMYKLKIQSPIKAIVYGSMRSLVCLLPFVLRKYTYRRYLRDQADLSYLINDHHELNG